MISKRENEVHDTGLGQGSLGTQAGKLSESSRPSMKLNVLYVLKEVGLRFMVRERRHG